MKINNIEQIDDFLSAVAASKKGVWLYTPSGDKFNLKSPLCRYIAIGKLLGEYGDLMELYCDSKDDIPLFFDFFKEHPETL